MATDLAPWEERWVWLCGSLLLALLSAWIAEAFRHMGGKPGAWYQRWQRWPGRPWVLHTVRVLYAVGIPATALIWRGALKESSLGLQPFPWQNTPLSTTSLPHHWEDWLRDGLWALGIGIAVTLLIQWTQVTLKRAGHPWPALRGDGLLSLREAVIHEVHWAFYREPWLLLWPTPIGVWAGWLLVGLEAALNPARWRDLRTPLSSRTLVLRAALAVISALLFLQTQNLWLAIVTHTCLDWAWRVSSNPNSALTVKNSTTA